MNKVELTRTTPDWSESNDPVKPLRTNGATIIPGEKAKMPKPISNNHESPVLGFQLLILQL